MSEQSKAVDRYLETVPEARREALATLRGWIHEALPEAQDVIEYNMPGAFQDALICSYKSQKNYMSLYMDVEIVARHKAELDEAGLNCGKSCIRFRRIEQLPQETIKRMLRETAEKQALEQQAK